MICREWQCRAGVQPWGNGRRAESELSKALIDQLWEDPGEPGDFKDLVQFYNFLQPHSSGAGGERALAWPSQGY